MHSTAAGEATYDLYSEQQWQNKVYPKKNALLLQGTPLVIDIA